MAAHASSVFANSCISTPRNPKTNLPADKRERLRNSHRLLRDYREKVGEPQHTSFHGQQLMSSARIQGQGSLSTEIIPPKRPYTAPAGPAPTFTTESPIDNKDDGSLDYSALFSTLLESNTLLREDIHQLQQEHSKTPSTLETHHGRERVDACSSPRTPSASLDVNDSLRETEGNYRNQTPSDDVRLSHSLPPRLLKNTWVQSELSSSGHKEHERLSSSLQPDENVSGSSLSHDSSGHKEETEFQSEGELVDVEMLSDAASAHSTPLGSIHSSHESLSTSQSSEEERVSSDSDPFASPGVLAIERMWEDFSVEDYGPYEPSPDEPKKPKQWSPCITITEPFSMTLRDERTPKRKSKSILIAERERLEREAREQAELKKQFHATPVPANTYLPLYELIDARNQQRRENVKRLTKEILTSTERPFHFMKREEKKKQLKSKLLRQSQEMAKAEAKEEQFRARPFPKHLFDSKVDEEVHEQEEYRRIRIKMRAEELLAVSKLPGNMQVKGREYTIGATRKKQLEENQDRAFLTQEHKFHPRVNAEVPDYDQAYLDFQRELARRKKSKQTTTTEPFYLRTQLIPSRKKQIEEDIQQDREVQRWPYLAPRTKLPRKSTATHMRSNSTPSYPAQMTETAHIRQSMTRERLANAAEKELAEEDWRREKKERERELQRMVSQKSLSHDLTAWLEERKRLKLQQFR